MGLKLYMIEGSPPVRSVLMAAKALNLDLELKRVDLPKGENKTEAFLKINPQHTVPVLDDNGFILWESHAILSYLVEKYAKNDSLYPKDIAKRAVINQRLHFDSSVFVIRYGATVKSLFFEKKNILNPVDIKALKEAYEFLEKFLEGKEWIAGDTLTVADYCIISTATAANVHVPIDPKEWPKFAAWMRKVEALPEYQVSKESLDIYINYVNTLKA